MADGRRISRDRKHTPILRKSRYLTFDHFKVESDHRKQNRTEAPYFVQQSKL
jgi:hypothetical protein